MMEEWRSQTAKTELMAFASVLGVPTCKAPSFVETCLASLDQARNDGASERSAIKRSQVFQAIVEAAPSARSGPAGLGLVEAAKVISEASTGPFRVAPDDVRGALFLVSALDFGLDEAAAVFRSDAVSLSRRLEQLLDQIDRIDRQWPVAGAGSGQAPT